MDSDYWHAVCSLLGNLQDWLPGVAGTDPRLGYRFWGVNYEEGACTSPLFHFLPFSLPLVRQCLYRPPSRRLVPMK